MVFATTPQYGLKPSWGAKIYDRKHPKAYEYHEWPQTIPYIKLIDLWENIQSKMLMITTKFPFVYVHANKHESKISPKRWNKQWTKKSLFNPRKANKNSWHTTFCVQVTLATQSPTSVVFFNSSLNIELLIMEHKASWWLLRNCVVISEDIRFRQRNWSLITIIYGNPIGDVNIYIISSHYLSFRTWNISHIIGLDAHSSIWKIRYPGKTLFSYLVANYVV